MVPFLSICIPTFNRQEDLTALFPELARQIEPFAGKVELIVVDNCSDVPASSYLPARGGKIIRNPANIGAAGNILRAVEAASGQFLWLMGDDDRVPPGAVQACLQQCEEASSASHIFFSNCFVSHARTIVSRNAQEFCAQFTPNRYGGLLWMSSQVINRLHALDVIRYAYAYPGSSPQMAFALLNAHRTIVFSSVEIASHTQGDADRHWNPDTISAQMSQLLMLPLTPGVRRSLASALAEFITTLEAHFIDVLKSHFCNAADAVDRTHIFLSRFLMIATARGDAAMLQKTMQCEKILRDPSLRTILYKQFKFGANTKPSVVSKLATNYVQ